MNNPRVSIVASMAKKRAIGKGGMIPWHITPDLLRFKDKCLNHTVILGRKTFESLLGYYEKSGKSLPGRFYIIVTGNPTFDMKRNHYSFVHSFDEALEKAKKIESEEIIIAGGSMIFRQAITVVERLYLTIIDKEVSDADAFFPNFASFTKEIERIPGEYKGIHYTFITLEKK